MTTAKWSKALHVLDAPRNGTVITAPPVLIASHDVTDFCCGHCGTLLMHADDDQVHNLIVRCAQCGSYNSTDF